MIISYVSIIILVLTFIIFSIYTISMAEEVHYNKLVGKRPVKITNKYYNVKKKSYMLEVTRHEFMSKESYQAPSVIYENKYDKYFIRINEKDYHEFDKGDYVIIVAKKNNSTIELYETMNKEVI